MLRQLPKKELGDRDKMLTYLLFAYQEVPQVRGPLHIQYLRVTAMQKSKIHLCWKLIVLVAYMTGK